MAIKPKEEVIAEHRLSDSDTGSPEVQRRGYGWASLATTPSSEAA